MIGLLTILIAYLIGSIPVGYLLVKLTSGKDVRKVGSGNIGATNVLRSSGRAVAIATLLLDIAKGFAAVWIAVEMTGGSPFWSSASALAVMGGNAFPVFLQFHGGKAFATFIGAFLCLTPLPLLSVLLVFVIVVAATRHISAGSIVAAGALPLGVWIILHAPVPIFLASLIAAVFIVYRHRANLERLRAGTENLFIWGRR